MTEPIQTRQDLFKTYHFISLNQPQKALDALKTINSDLIDLPEYWLLRATAFVQLKRTSEAKQACKEGLAREADHANLLYVLALCHLQEQALPEAERAILQALHQYPEDPDFLTTYARMLLAGKQIDKAKRILAEGQRIDPEHQPLKRLEAFIAYIEGDEKRAQQLSEEALTLDPDDLNSLHFLGGLHMEMGNLSQANRHLRTTVIQNPGNQNAVNTARQSKLLSHPLMWPLWPVNKWGSGVIWIGAMVIMFGLRALEQERLAVFFALFYIIWAIYTWTVPRLLRRWFARQQRPFR